MNFISNPHPSERIESSDRTDVSAPARSPWRWGVMLVAASLCWTAVLLYVQAESFRPGFSHGWVFQKFLVRFALNILFTSSCLLLLSRYLVIVPVVLSAFCGVGLIIYADYFDETMSVLSLIANFGEGAAVTEAVFALIPVFSVVLILFLTLACLVLLFCAGRPIGRYRYRSACGASLLFLYLAMIGVLSHCGDLSFNTLIREKEIGDLTIVYGHLPVWTAELFLKDEATLRENALQQTRTDRLSPVETHLSLPRQVVVVQVETLDFTIIDRKMNGKTVTPFLNELKTKSFFYKVDTFHYHGSSDADFAFLAAREPSKHLLNYKIKTFPYDDALPHAFNEHGYRTYSFHNAHAKYFNRQSAFRKMGFRQINFIEDLVEKYPVTPENIFGWKAIRDDALFGIVSDAVAGEKEKSFFFVITLIGHTPFTTVRERDIFENPTKLLHFYANTVHVMDRQLKDFYDSLPDGTFLVIYGDHCSNIDDSDYVSRKAGEKDYVPCMISIVGESISDRQTTASGIALGGELSLVDMSNYLRSLLTPRLAERRRRRRCRRPQVAARGIAFIVLQVKNERSDFCTERSGVQKTRL